MEGQTGKALEIALLLKDSSVEYKLAQDDGNCLLAGLQATLPNEQVVALIKQENDKISGDQTEAVTLAYVLKYE